MELTTEGDYIVGRVDGRAVGRWHPGVSLDAPRIEQLGYGCIVVVWGEPDCEAGGYRCACQAHHEVRFIAMVRAALAAA